MSVQTIVVLHKCLVGLFIVWIIIATNRYIKSNFPYKGWVRYAITMGIALIMIVSFVILSRKFGLNRIMMTNLFLIYLLSMITIHDAHEKIIPIKLLFLGGTFSVLLLINNPNLFYIEGIFGAVILGVGMYVISKVTRGGIGLGDVLVFMMISMLLGWEMSLAIFVLALMLTGILGIILILFKKAHKKTSLPFIPFVLIVTLTVLYL